MLQTHEPVRTSTNQYEPVRTSTNQYEPVRTNTNQYEPVRTSTNQYEPARTSSSMHVDSMVRAFQWNSEYDRIEASRSFLKTRTGNWRRFRKFYFGDRLRKVPFLVTVSSFTCGRTANLEKKRFQMKSV